MSCVQTLSGIAASCDTNVGGIRIAYICNYSDVTGITVDSETNMVDEITMAASAKFKTYNFRQNSSSLVSTLNVDPVNGVNFVQSDLTLIFAKQETVKRMEVARLSLGELRVIVKDSNNKYWLLGEEEPVYASAGTAETGTARTDGNRYSITLTDVSASYPHEVDSSIIAGLVE